MDSQNLQPFIQAIKKDKKDPWAWLQLGDAARLMSDWETAAWAYAASAILLPDDEVARKKFSEARNHFLANKNLAGAFGFRLFKLPLQANLFLLFGVMNTVLESLESQIRHQGQKGTSHIILDFSGVSAISGLGPSFLRRMSEYIEKKAGHIWLIRLSQEIKDVLQLKKVEVIEYDDLEGIMPRLSEP